MNNQRIIQELTEKEFGIFATQNPDRRDIIDLQAPTVNADVITVIEGFGLTIWGIEPNMDEDGKATGVIVHLIQK